MLLLRWQEHLVIYPAIVLDERATIIDTVECVDLIDKCCYVLLQQH